MSDYETEERQAIIELNKVKEMTNQMTLRPANLTEAMQYAELIAKSDMVPCDYKGKPANVMLAVQWGAEIGLPPMQSLQNIAVINGRPSIYGDAMLAVVRGSGLLEYIHETKENGVAVCTIKRVNEPEALRTFSIDDAKKANLWGKQGPWTKYPDRMLQMRARSWALRDVFPDVIRGLHIAEEAQDIPAKQSVMSEPVRVDLEPKPAAYAALTEGQQALNAKKKELWSLAQNMTWDLAELTDYCDLLLGKQLDKITLSDADELLQNMLDMPLAHMAK